MIHFGILGAGNIAHRFMQGIDCCDHAIVDIVYTRNLEKGKAFIEKHHISRAVDDLDAFLASEVDAVYVATPHQCHASDILKCLEANKHVLCEKPMFVKLEEAESLMSLAKQKHLLLMEAMKVCFLPTTLQAKAWLKEGKLGNLKHITATFCRDSKNSIPEGSYLWDKKVGGALFDVGCYPIAFCNFLMDERPSVIPKQIDCEKGVDVSSSLELKYADVSADVACSFAYTLENKAEIVGELGRIVIKDFWKAHKMCFIGEKEETIEYEAVPEFYYQIDHFCRCIEAGLDESKLMTHALSKLNLACMLKGKEE